MLDGGNFNILVTWITWIFRQAKTHNTLCHKVVSKVVSSILHRLMKLSRNSWTNQKDESWRYSVMAHITIMTNKISVPTRRLYNLKIYPYGTHDKCYTLLAVTLSYTTNLEGGILLIHPYGPTIFMIQHLAAKADHIIGCIFVSTSPVDTPFWHHIGPY